MASAIVAVLVVSAGAARSMNITLSVPFPGNKRASGAECQSWWGSFALCSQNLERIHTHTRARIHMYVYHSIRNHAH